MPPGIYRTPSGKIKARPNPDPFFKPVAPKPSGGGLTGFASHAFHTVTSDVGKAAHYINNAEHTHNVQMKQQFAAMDARGGPNDPFGSLVHLVGRMVKNKTYGLPGLAKSATIDYNYANRASSHIPGIKQINDFLAQDPTVRTMLGKKNYVTIGGKRTQVNLGIVDPSGIDGLIRAGGAVFMPKEGETVDSLMARVGQHVNVRRLGPRATPGSESIPGRIPMVIEKRTGRITIGANGETHGELLRRMFPNSLTTPYNAYHQGFLFDPAAFDEALGSGVGERAPMTLNFGRELRAGYSQPKVQALQKFLQDMFQKGSPYTNTEVKPYGPGTRHY